MSSDNNVILADSIAYLPHLAAFDLLVKKRFDDLQLDALLIYLIDTVDESALVHLANQFDVMGFKGYGLAQTVTDKREVIKRAIELHRYKGTIYAIKQALNSIGYPSENPDGTPAIIITEHVNGHWARFKVTVELAGNTISVASIANLVQMITEYKNTRSWLDEIGFTLTLEADTVTAEDESTENEAAIDEDIIFAGGNFKYDGTYSYDGSKNYSQDADVLTITIV